MKGSETLLLGFMEGANFRYVIPVYQRKYDWKLDNCRQLFEDLKRIIRDDRRSHFFGSLVSMVVPAGATIEYHIIDGQQRLTTITLLLLAMSNLISKGTIHSEEENLDQQILQRFIIAPWAKAGDRIKLRPIKRDSEALEKLIEGDSIDYIKDSNLTINYRFFCDQLMKEEVSVDELFAAINKLEIISITLDHDDRPQLIFESLNATGLALQEGDKIRNYILMGLKPEDQIKYYDGYWTKIELCTGQELSSFIRDYLSIKEQVTPTIGNVYQAFKQYSEDRNLPISDLLEDILRYARIYKKLKKGKSGLKNKALDDCLKRLNRLEIVVTEPFFMEVFRLNEDELISTEEISQILLITENYLFRRNICEVPTNALNKVFLTLNSEIIKYDNSPSDYVNKFIYALLNKRESGRFPGDEEFKESLSAKQVYMMRGKYKAYLFERFENYGTVETKDVYNLLDAGTYSIEHIMPQHLNPAWRESLGSDAESIHITWLHRLGNLTLTGYNSKMSNRSFQEKRDGENGYKQSGLRMNQKIALKNTWGEAEIQERNAEMVDLAVKTIWPLPSTSYVRQKKEYDSCSLDDSSSVLTGRDITSFLFKNIETPVNSWTDMYEHILKYLHKKDQSVLSSIAYGSTETELSTYISAVPEQLRSDLKIDEDIFVE